MTVGFTATGPEGDYFVMNHRIRSVHVRAGSEDLGVSPLNPDDRGLQELMIDRMGRDITIEVVDTVPGTRATWREVCISELEAWGTPGAGASTTDPIVSVAEIERRALEPSAPKAS